VPKEAKRPNQAAIVGKARVSMMELAHRIAVCRAKTPPQDPTGECHRALADIAERCNRDVGDLVEEWHERAAAREYEGGASRDDAERAAVVDIEAAYAPMQGAML